MNSNDNEGLTRKQFDEAVFEAQDLNPYAVAVLKAFASRNSYDDDAQETYPGQAWVANESHINKDTVKDYVDALVEDGWLLPTQMHGRAQGYYLTAGTVKHPQLLKAKRTNNLGKGKASPDRQEMSTQSDVLTEPGVSPDGAFRDVLMEPGVSPDSQELITRNNHKEEPLNNQTVAGAPVKTDSPTKEDSDSSLPLKVSGPEESSYSEGNSAPVDDSSYSDKGAVPDSGPVATATTSPGPPAVAPVGEEEFEREMKVAEIMATSTGRHSWRTEADIRERQNVVRLKYGREPVPEPVGGW